MFFFFKTLPHSARLLIAGCRINIQSVWSENVSRDAKHCTFDRCRIARTSVGGMGDTRKVGINKANLQKPTKQVEDLITTIKMSFDIFNFWIGLCISEIYFFRLYSRHLGLL
jgi:hypothetical protein